MVNQKIRIAILESGVKHWEVALKLGIAEASFSRKLRHELPEEEQAKILEAIECLKGGN